MQRETASILDKAPAIIEASAKSPLALAALIILVLGFLAFFYFRDAKESTRTAIFVMIGLGAFTLLTWIVTQGMSPTLPQEGGGRGAAVGSGAGTGGSGGGTGTGGSVESGAARREARVAMGVPVVSHNAATPRGLGISVTVPGSIDDARGRTAQLVVNFTFANGAPVWANVQEAQYRTADGMVATGTAPFQVSADSLDLKSLPVSIPYFAFNMIPTGGYSRVDLLLTASVYLDGAVSARSPSLPVTFYW